MRSIPTHPKWHPRRKKRSKKTCPCWVGSLPISRYEYNPSKRNASEKTPTLASKPYVRVRNHASTLKDGRETNARNKGPMKWTNKIQSTTPCHRRIERWKWKNRGNTMPKTCGERPFQQQPKNAIIQTHVHERVFRDIPSIRCHRGTIGTMEENLAGTNRRARQSLAQTVPVGWDGTLSWNPRNG